MNICAFLILRTTVHCFLSQRDLAGWDCALSEIRTEVSYPHIIYTPAILKDSLSSERFQTFLHDICNILPHVLHFPQNMSV